MKKKKNAFTLIELLAIIVILAIIAVITVPIILNIIENSKKGTATDSAYGYKDSVNKAYITELQNHNKLKLNGTYTVNSDGSLTPADENTNFNDDDYDSLNVPVSGTIPSSGSLTYENNVLKSGYLVIGDYRVTFNSDGTVTTTKNTIISGNEQPLSALTMDEMCPGCKFIFTTNYYAIEGTYAENNYSSDMPTAEDGLTNDYTTLQKPYFLGLIESTTDSTKIGRVFACGIENGTPFCLEGYDTSKWSDEANVGVLNTIFPSCNASASVSYAGCSGSSVYGTADDHGRVDVGDGSGNCDVDIDGYVYCYE